MHTLLKLVLVISSVVFGLSFVVRTQADSKDQQQTDARVALVSGITFLISGLALWLTGW